MAKISQEEMRFLSKFESNFRTAAKSQPYTTKVPYEALVKMNEIRTRLSGVRQNLNAFCAPCVIDLLRYVGKAYNEQKDAPVEEVPGGESAAVPAKPKRTRKPRSTKAKLTV